VVWQAMGRVSAGPQQSSGLYPPHRGTTHPKQAVGRVRLQAKLFFLCYFLTETVLIVFCSDFEQISNSFLYSNYSNEKFV
jgi:hypothetical protein